MCEIFPEVDSCCIIADLRLGMLFISVFAIWLLLIAVAKGQGKGKEYKLIPIGLPYRKATPPIHYADHNFVEWLAFAITLMRLNYCCPLSEPKKIASSLGTLIPAGITACSAAFIVSGLFLLFGNLGAQEGLIQVFVWLTFLIVLVGYTLIIMVAFECMMLEGCLIGGMDWLSSAAFLVFTFFYLCVWIYFIIVANSSIFTM